MIWLLLYYIVTLALVVCALHKHPPKHHERTAEEWFIAIMLCWLIWPAAILDLKEIE